MSRKSQPSALATTQRLRPEPQRKLFQLPKLHEKQLQVFNDPARFKVVVTGRQFGKTYLGATVCVAAASLGGSIWWVAPTFDLTERGWKVILELVGKVPGIRVEGRPVWRVTFPDGGSIQAKSADNPDSLRGATLHGLVVDEAAQAKPEAWPILRPTLAIRKGFAMFISTPQGTNWFWELYQDAGNLAGWERWLFPSDVSPYLDTEEMETSRETMPSVQFSQEYLAEFTADLAAFHSEWVQHYRTELVEDDRIYRLGDEAVVALSDCSTFHTVDLAWTTKEESDYTVISSWAVTPKKHLILVDCIRGHFEGPDVVPKMRLAYDKWGGVVVVERATRQMSIIQEAVRSGLPVKEVRADKQKEERAWIPQAKMERGEVWFPPRSVPWWPTLEEELLSFPLSKHDDFVDTLSYAALQVAERSRYESGGLITV